jgi:hypothetical protein
VSIPPFTGKGDLPDEVHPASLNETLNRFGWASPQRRFLAVRLERIYQVAQLTGDLARFIVFGSFVTSKLEPNDVDVFMLMEDTFDASQVTGEARLLFDHAGAQAHFGASVFWLRRLAALEGEQNVVEY